VRYIQPFIDFLHTTFVEVQIACRKTHAKEKGRVQPNLWQPQAQTMDPDIRPNTGSPTITDAWSDTSQGKGESRERVDKPGAAEEEEMELCLATKDANISEY